MANDPAAKESRKSFGPRPIYRSLQGYAFDPSLSAQLDTALINRATFKIPWEDLEPGPVGEYVEVVDFDPASGCFYEPVDLDDRYIIASSGLAPSEANPKFHQQMVYAVAMTTIKNFEKALGRKTLWSSFREVFTLSNDGSETKKTYPKDYIGRLRIYPHALREANAYYSPTKKALLFGYFPATSDSPGELLPNGMVFTCLSHDIIAHETTHALLDGIHRRFIEGTHLDTLAFHEAFADIVALFQHFSFPEVLKHQIAKTRGRLNAQNLLGELAQQFGQAIGQYGALRNFIGGFNEIKREWEPHIPKPEEYHSTKEPHSRGAILVAAIFETFLSIYKARIADLLRIATGGSGVLPDGELHPDLVNRLADEAAKTAKHILNICIRALDYCPPVDITFGDYLRALITADLDLVPYDELGYRIALIDAFKKRGIYPRDIRTLSEESLQWKKFEKADSGQLKVFSEIAKSLRKFIHQLDYLDQEPENMFDSFSAYFADASKKPWKEKGEREKIYDLTQAGKKALHDLFVDFKQREAGRTSGAVPMLGDKTIEEFEKITGLHLVERPDNKKKLRGMASRNKKYTFEVHSLRSARRVKPDGGMLNLVVISITQNRKVAEDPDVDWSLLTENERENTPCFNFRGGCTLVLNLDDLSLRYAIVKKIDDSINEKGDIIENPRLARQRHKRLGGEEMSLRATYFSDSMPPGFHEPFAMLHRGSDTEGGGE